MCENSPRLVLLFVIALVVTLSECSRKKPRPSLPHLEVKVPTIQICPKTVSSYVTDVNYEEANGTRRINGTLLKPVKAVTKLVASISVCHTGRCEHFQTWRWYAPQPCNVMNQTNMFWYPFIGHFEPPIRCPFKPGFYKTDNAVIDTRLIQNLPFPREVSEWHATVDAYEDETHLVCFFVIADVQQVA